MLRFIYTVLLYLIQSFIWIKLLWRSRKSSGYRKRILERYGFYKKSTSLKPDSIVIHSVSVGETVAAIPFIRALQQKNPTQPILVTTMTVTGSDLVQKTFAHDPLIQHVYLPYDLPDAIQRFLKKVQPKLFIIMETELWPNLIYALAKHKTPLILANARLSARSAKRYEKLNHILGQNMRHLLERISLVAAQNQIDGDRFLKLGLPKKQLAVTGTIKFDIHLTANQQETIEHLKKQWQLIDRLVWIAASTHQGEDEILLKAHQALLNDYPDLLLILVPRHPERFPAVEQQLKNHPFTYQTVLALKQNQVQNEIAQNIENNAAFVNAKTSVLLGNTMGDLPILYGLAQIAFIGGSLISRGGHNPLEAALHHLPILIGPYFFNFQVVCEQLKAARALLEVDSETDLILALKSLFSDPKKREQMGQNGAQVLAQNQGALERLISLVDNME